MLIHYNFSDNFIPCSGACPRGGPKGPGLPPPLEIEKQKKKKKKKKGLQRKF